MHLQEALSYIMKGKGILFAGSGFSTDAINLNGREFAVAEVMCQRLIEDGKINVEGESERDIKDLAYISERYLETNTKRDLLGFLHKEFVCKKYSSVQEEIIKLPWKRIYTTNYDDIIEKISEANGLDRESVETATESRNVNQQKNANAI